MSASGESQLDVCNVLGRIHGKPVLAPSGRNGAGEYAGVCGEGADGVDADIVGAGKDISEGAHEALEAVLGGLRGLWLADDSWGFLGISLSGGRRGTTNSVGGKTGGS